MTHTVAARDRSLKRRIRVGSIGLSARMFLVLLMAAATALAVFIWTRQSLTLDEAQSIWQTSRDLPGLFNVIAKDVHVPLFFIGLHYWEIAFGTTELALRSFSLVFFLVSIPAIFVLAKEAYSERVAYFTAFITAISPFLNWYGSDARMYSMMFLFTILSHLFYIRLWRRPSATTWFGYTVVTFLGLFTHLFFLFVIFTQAVYFLVKRKIFPPDAMRKLAVIGVSAGAATGAWFVYRHIAGAGLTNPVLAQPSSVDFFNVFSNFFIGFQTDPVNTFYLSLWPLVVFVGFTFLARRRPHQPETSYFMAASFIPILLAFVVSMTVEPIFLSRYLIISLPSIYILAVYFLSSYRPAISDLLLSILSISMLSMLVVQAIEPLSPVKEDFRDAAGFVSASATPSDLFVVSAPFITYPVEYYYHGAARLSTFPEWDRYLPNAQIQPFSLNDLAQTTQSWQQVYERVFFLLGYDQGYNEKIRLFMDEHYQRVFTQTFSPGLTLYVYKLRYP
ncbi:MAG: glycosyltransferase family 39 protein [Patescibacteria group bacterium]|nr:glycosyltransferase family 39 protein [Patescibacteria group bacterium]